MKVLVACEFSGVVRDAFIAKGHNAMSCDLRPTEKPGPHYHGDVFNLINCPRDAGTWDLMIAHPPCTHLSVSGARWCVDHWVKRKNKPPRWHDGSLKRIARTNAIEFFLRLAGCGIPRICIENPVCIMSTQWRKPDQFIEPWQFGHGETKKTALWLKGLPLLQPTKIVEGRENRIWKMPPSPERERAKQDLPGNRGCDGATMGKTDLKERGR